MGICKKMSMSPIMSLSNQSNKLCKQFIGFSADAAVQQAGEVSGILTVVCTGNLIVTSPSLV